VGAAVLAIGAAIGVVGYRSASLLAEYSGRGAAEPTRTATPVRTTATVRPSAKSTGRLVPAFKRVLTWTIIGALGGVIVPVTIAMVVPGLSLRAIVDQAPWANRAESSLAMWMALFFFAPPAPILSSPWANLRHLRVLPLARWEAVTYMMCFATFPALAFMAVVALLSRGVDGHWPLWVLSPPTLLVLGFAAVRGSTKRVTTQPVMASSLLPLVLVPAFLFGAWAGFGQGTLTTAIYALGIVMLAAAPMIHRARLIALSSTMPVSRSLFAPPPRQ
jgi:hypothetical protein